MGSVIALRAFKDNYIWLFVDLIAQAAWIVDPGDALPVIHYLTHNHLELAGILVTHHHRDHSGGVTELIKHGKNIPVYGFVNSSVPEVTHFVKEQDEVTCGSFKFSVLEIPGHTLDHIAFYNDEILFCGDTLFSAGCGRVFEGTYAQMYHSIIKLAQLPDQIKLYCAHEYTLQNLCFAEYVEPENRDIQDKISVVKKLLADNQPTLPTMLADEKKFNPFLRCHLNEVKRAVEKYTGKHPANPEQVFRYLREWKDAF